MSFSQTHDCEEWIVQELGVSDLSNHKAAWRVRGFATYGAWEQIVNGQEYKRKHR